MSTTVAVLLAAAIIATSLVMSQFFNGRANRVARIEDYSRAESLADRAAEQTRLLIDATEQIARRTNETGDVLEGKLNVIHSLVNSAMTAAKQSECDAIEREVAMMREVIALHEAMGRPPSPAAEEALAQTNHKLLDLRAELADRRAQDEMSRQQTEQATSQSTRRRAERNRGDIAAAERATTAEAAFRPQSPPLEPRPPVEVEQRFESEDP